MTTLSQTFGDNKPKQLAFLLKFIDQCQSISHDIAQAITEKNSQQIEFCAHKLKSSAQMVGALPLAEICIAMETAAKQSQWQIITTAQPTFSQQVHELEQWVNQFTDVTE